MSPEAARRRGPAITPRLVAQARESALAAIQTFNNPLIRFKSETFIVLMTISWTYLLHAHYRKAGIEYRYYERHGSRRVFARSSDGAFRYWELTKCLDAAECPLDNETKQNLRFLVGLRNEITHHMIPILDDFVSARYQACCLNFHRYTVKFFGAKAGIDRFLNYSLQLERLSREQFAAPQPDDLPGHVRSYIARFDAGLTEDELNSDRFAYRVLFVPRLVGKPGQADEVVEFVKTNAAITDAANREYVHFKEVERTKYLPSRIVKMMKEEGYSRFTMQDHTDLWRAHCAKDPAQGYGVAVERSWYWYQSWVDLVRKHCSDNVANLQ